MEEEYKKTRATLNQLQAKYPNKVPVLVEFKDGKDTNIYKILADTEQTMSTLLLSVRKRIKLSSEEAVFLFIYHKVKGSLLEDVAIPSLNKTVAEINREFGHDGIIKCVALKEATFGDGEKNESWIVI